MAKFKTGDRVVMANHGDTEEFFEARDIPLGATGVVLEDDFRPYVNWDIAHPPCYYHKGFQNVYAVEEEALSLEGCPERELTFVIPQGISKITIKINDE